MHDALQSGGPAPAVTGRRADAGRPPSRVTPARACAFAVVRRVFEQDAWADRALHAEARRLALDPREHALATQLAYGVVQRLGTFQLVFLDRIPAHAAVAESVELAKPASRGGAGLVNAVLRRAAREGRARVAALPDGTPGEAALRHSHPEWIARLWFAALGPEAARALMEAGNRAAEPALRANLLRTTAADLAARLPVPSRAAEDLPEGLVLEAPFDAFGSPLWEEGLFMPQSRAAMAVSRLLAPRPGEAVLDLCAAPGAKTTHLAALMGDEGRIMAVERHPGRAKALARTAERMGAGAVEVRTADAGEPQELEAYDR